VRSYWRTPTFSSWTSRESTSRQSSERFVKANMRAKPEARITERPVPTFPTTGMDYLCCRRSKACPKDSMTDRKLERRNSS
jgi:hypothetical protein